YPAAIGGVCLSVTPASLIGSNGYRPALRGGISRMIRRGRAQRVHSSAAEPTPFGTNPHVEAAVEVLLNEPVGRRVAVPESVHRLVARNRIVGVWCRIARI